MSVEELPNEPQFFQDDPARPMMMDPDGNAMGLRDWTKLYEDMPARTLMVTPVGKHEVRTVWQGLVGGDFLCGTSDNPEIFGSVIVYHHETPCTDMSREEALTIMRSAFGSEILSGTREAALEAHQVLVSELEREGTPT